MSWNFREKFSYAITLCPGTIKNVEQYQTFMILYYIICPVRVGAQLGSRVLEYRMYCLYNAVGTIRNIGLYRKNQMNLTNFNIVSGNSPKIGRNVNKTNRDRCVVLRTTRPFAKYLIFIEQAMFITTDAFKKKLFIANFRDGHTIVLIFII